MPAFTCIIELQQITSGIIKVFLKIYIYTMDDNFFTYLQRLELIAFFSGYPLLYAVILSVAGKKQARNNIKSKAVSLLPYTYALVATLYLGLQVKNLYPDYSIEDIKLAMGQPLLTTWALLALLFWIPALPKKLVISLLHSIVFFFFLIKDLIVHSSSGGDPHVIKNDMKVYTDSLLVNVFAFIAVASVFFLYLRISRKNKHGHQ